MTGPLDVSRDLEIDVHCLLGQCQWCWTPGHVVAQIMHLQALTHFHEGIYDKLFLGLGSAMLGSHHEPRVFVEVPE